MSKSAVMVFSKDAVNGCWKWGEYSLPIVSSYSYLGIDFSRNGDWDMHIRKLLDNGRKRVNQVHKVISVNYQLSTAIYYRPFPYRLSTTACAVRLRKINGFTFSLERGAVGAVVIRFVL